MELEKQIQIVAEARKKAVELKVKRDALVEAFNKTNQGLFDTLTQAGAEVAETEATLRELTLQAYAKTGNKAPAEGVGIREVTRLAYDPSEALSWATEHNMALKLDVVAFEKIVKASPLDFVTVTTEPQATIATDLSKVVKEEK